MDRWWVILIIKQRHTHSGINFKTNAVGDRVCVCVCVCVTMKKKCQTNGKHDKRHRRYFKQAAASTTQRNYVCVCACVCLIWGDTVNFTKFQCFGQSSSQNHPFSAKRYSNRMLFDDCSCCIAPERGHVIIGGLFTASTNRVFQLLCQPKLASIKTKNKKKKNRGIASKHRPKQAFVGVMRPRQYRHGTLSKSLQRFTATFNLKRFSLHIVLWFLCSVSFPLGVAGLVVNGKDQVLVVQERHRGGFRPHWKLPGGLADPGECCQASLFSFHAMTSRKWIILPTVGRCWKTV